MMRILVADDHSLFRDGLVSLLKAAGYDVVGQVGNGIEAVEKTRELQPDVVLLDLKMPKLSGQNALVKIRATVPDTKVVILTVSEDDHDLHEAIKHGAHGYLLKSLDAEQFLKMLAGLKYGEAAITRKTAARLMSHIAGPTTSQHGNIEKLTTRELQLLKYVSQGLSNRAIAQLLSISHNTVKYHMKNILQKIGAQNRTEAVAQAIRSGQLELQEDNIED